MTKKFYKTVVSDLNKELKRKNRRGILFVDNASSHDPDLEFSNLKVKFFPPNTTPVLQPLDGGGIMAGKRHYRKRQLRHVLSKIDDPTVQLTGSEICKSINVYMALQWIAASIKEIKPSTIQKCFAACGFPTSSESPVADDDDEDDIPLARLLDNTSQRLNITTLTPEDLLQFESDVQLEEDYSEGWEERAAELSEPAPEEDPEEEACSLAPPPLPSLTEVLTTLRRAEQYCLSKGDSLGDSLDHLSSVIGHLEGAAARGVGMKQTSMKEFFSSKPSSSMQ